jgi:hypothetical protein
MGGRWLGAWVLSAALCSLPAHAQQPAAAVVAPADAASTPAEPAAANTRPFGPGTAVSLSSDRAHAYAFVARGAMDTRPSYPDPFVKVGRIPVTLELPSGLYTVIVESDNVTTGSKVFEVGQTPVRVTVKAGASGLRELSGWTMALGAVALLAGGVFELSGTAGDSDREKHAIAIPLFIGGGVALGGGLAMWLASGTRLQADPVATGAGDRAGSTPGLTIFGQF